MEGVLPVTAARDEAPPATIAPKAAHTTPGHRPPNASHTSPRRTRAFRELTWDILTEMRHADRKVVPSLRAQADAPTVPTWLAPCCTSSTSRHVATITYNRPDALNAINGEMRRDLNDAFARFRDDEEAWVAIVTGAGRAFCAGADMRGEGNSAGDFPGTFWEKPTQNSFESGWEIFKPVIAAVNGYCLGYGLTLVTWCDFVIASERATFGFPEVRIGVPTIVGAIRLPQRIGWQSAMEMLLTGERIDAERAKEIGLAGWVVPHDDLLAGGQRPRRSAAAGRAARPARHQGGGDAVRAPLHGRSDPLRRDHAQGRRRDRGRGRGSPGLPRPALPELARPIAILRRGRDVGGRRRGAQEMGGESGSPDPLADARVAREIRSTRRPQQDLRGAPGW